VGRAQELLAITQSVDRHDQGRHVDEVDKMLAEAKHRGEPRMVAQLLRYAVAVRLQTAGRASTAEPLLDEMLAHTRRHGLVVLQADAHALRGRLLVSGAEDVALSEAAIALAMLDDDLSPDYMIGRRKWDLLLASTLMDIGLVLTQLGVYEEADQVMARAAKCIRDSAGPHHIATHLTNRTRLLLGWALRLERIGKLDEAAERFGTAAAIAAAVEAPFRESLYPRDGDRPAADLLPVIASAHAFADPSLSHVSRLRNLLRLAHYPRELIILAVALSRCLERSGHVDEALDVLDAVRAQLGDDGSEPTLRVCLLREFARLSGPDGGQRTNVALQSYASELETQLWELRETRIATLRMRREHERLAREHGAIARQALQDPLTGLPNRRALDERLQALAASPGYHPLAVALVDLDGFKAVNDQFSHAEGDNVLRVVASTLRDALRGDDMVARYGGDEFVVLLPGATLPAAELALRRTCDAVARLPPTLSHGVTLSIGVVSLRPQETVARALSRADAAMYEAKRDGGNGIAAGAPVMDASATGYGSVVDPVADPVADPGRALPEAT